MTVVVRLETDLADKDESADIRLRWMESRSQSNLWLELAAGIGPIGSHTEAAQDFLAIAVCAYSADRSILREAQLDGWTRWIHLEVPVLEPERWDLGGLEQLISFLTGDHWSIELRRGKPHPPLRQNSELHRDLEVVCLFSGGVDSLSGALEAMAGDVPLALVSYFGDSPTGSLQRSLRVGIGPDLPHHGFRIGTSSTSDGWDGYVDSTMRSRSLLFLALGLLCAEARGAARLRMAENGYIAVNVPLHEGRIGSLSTHTAHPQFVDGLNRALRNGGVAAAIENPYLFLTKGDVTRRLVSLAPDLAPKTVSCAHPIGRWRGYGFQNCGYCYPCLIRRAGFHAAGQDATSYRTDPLSDLPFLMENPQSASDVRSVARSLLDPVRLGDLLSTGRFGSYEVAEKLHQMRQRGVGELVNLFQDQMSSDVASELGL